MASSPSLAAQAGASESRPRPAKARRRKRAAEDASNEGAVAAGAGSASSDQPDDNDLVRACRRGDTEAFGTLVERHQNRVLWIAYHMVRHWEEAADIAQEVFLRAFRSLDHYDVARSFGAWISRIAVNVAIDSHRKSERQPLLADEALALCDSGAPTPEDEALADERKRNVYRVLDRLPEKYRTVLMLKDIEDLPGLEIAEILQVDYQTARWRIHHARKLFKDLWDQMIEHRSREQP